MLVVSLYRIQRTPGGVVGVVHESGTKTYLHIPIIPRESEMKTLLLGELYVCVCFYTHTHTHTALPLNLAANCIFSPHVGVMCLNETSKLGSFSPTSAHR